MDWHFLFALFALVASLASLAYTIIQGKKTKALHRELEQRRAAEQAWINLQLQRWRDGELEARLEPALFGSGEQFVIEPVPGHKIVVGSARHGKLH